jgi:hypothetical protein
MHLSIRQHRCGKGDKRPMEKICTNEPIKIVKYVANRIQRFKLNKIDNTIQTVQ